MIKTQPTRILRKTMILFVVPTVFVIYVMKVNLSMTLNTGMNEKRPLSHLNLVLRGGKACVNAPLSKVLMILTLLFAFLTIVILLSVFFSALKVWKSA
jgi:hypothetical protein